jgi:hypothetical protein
MGKIDVWGKEIICVGVFVIKEQCVLSARTNVRVVATVEGGWRISEMITVRCVGYTVALLCVVCLFITICDLQLRNNVCCQLVRMLVWWLQSMVDGALVR